MLPAENQSIGQMLRDARLRRRLTLLEASQRTRIQVRYLECLELERWEEFPSEVHRQGFLRLYAAFLGASAEELILLYQRARHGAPVVKKVPSRSRFWNVGDWPWPRIMALGFVSALLIWIGGPLWVRRSSPYLSPSLRRFQPQHTRLPLARDRAVYRLTLIASTPAWIRLSQDRRLLFEGVLPSGVTRQWGVQRGVTLRVADRHAVQVLWDGVQIDWPDKTGNRFGQRTFPPPPVTP